MSVCRLEIVMERAPSKLNSPGQNAVNEQVRITLIGQQDSDATYVRGRKADDDTGRVPNGRLRLRLSRDGRLWGYDILGESEKTEERVNTWGFGVLITDRVVAGSNTRRI
jgi:hypothetical protein